MNGPYGLAWYAKRAERAVFVDGVRHQRISQAGESGGLGFEILGPESDVMETRLVGRVPDASHRTLDQLDVGRTGRGVTDAEVQVLGLAAMGHDPHLAAGDRCPLDVEDLAEPGHGDVEVGDRVAPVEQASLGQHSVHYVDPPG